MCIHLVALEGDAASYAGGEGRARLQPTVRVIGWVLSRLCADGSERNAVVVHASELQVICRLQTGLAPISSASRRKAWRCTSARVEGASCSTMTGALRKELPAASRAPQFTRSPLRRYLGASTREVCLLRKPKRVPYVELQTTVRRLQALSTTTGDLT